MIQERLLQLNLFNSPLLTICMRSHSVTITISKFHFILRHDRVVTGKDTTITMHRPYRLYHVTPKTHLQQLAYIYLTKVCLIY